MNQTNTFVKDFNKKRNLTPEELDIMLTTFEKNYAYLYDSEDNVIGYEDALVSDRERAAFMFTVMNFGYLE